MPSNILLGLAIYLKVVVICIGETLWKLFCIYALNVHLKLKTRMETAISSKAQIPLSWYKSVVIKSGWLTIESRKRFSLTDKHYKLSYIVWFSGVNT